VQPDDNSRIDNLNDSLYSRTTPDIRTRRKLRFGNTETTIKSDWEHPKLPKETETEIVTENQPPKKHTMSFFTKLLIASFVFCLIAVGVGAYIFLNGGNMISANNLDITIDGPISIPGGTPVSFDITVKNNNNIDLKLVDLSLDFPPGTSDPNDSSKEMSSYVEMIGDIPAGGSAKKTVRAIIFGEENTEKQIMANVTYQVKGSSSSFTKEKEYTLLVNSSPVLLTVSSFKEITSGQEFDIKVEIKSNSEEVLKNVLVGTTYPFGFTFLSADVKPLPDNATWRIGDIPPQGKKVINIHGKLQGEDTDTRVFRFAVGAQSSRNPNALGTEYMSASQEISIQKPFVTVGLAIDNDNNSGDAFGEFNKPVQVKVSWFNNLPSTVTDAEIAVKLSGTSYDKTLVQANGGYFRSATDEIIWNQQTTKQLASIGAGESGEVTFTVIPRDLGSKSKPITNPVVNLSASIAGKRTQETGVSSALKAITSRTVRISTGVTLSGRVVRTVGPIANTGPIPPKAENQTTYTVVWSVDNTVNTVKNAKVTATIPPYVKWTGKISPETEDITIDKDSGLITWNVGNVGTYTAGSSLRKEVYFQLSIEPSVNQIGTAPNLINEANLTAIDSFTNIGVKAAQSYLTTRFSTDSSYREGNESVVK